MILIIILDIGKNFCRKQNMKKSLNQLAYTKEESLRYLT